MVSITHKFTYRHLVTCSSLYHIKWCKFHFKSSAKAGQSLLSFTTGPRPMMFTEAKTTIKQTGTARKRDRFCGSILSEQSKLILLLSIQFKTCLGLEGVFEVSVSLLANLSYSCSIFCTGFQELLELSFFFFPKINRL